MSGTDLNTLILIEITRRAGAMFWRENSGMLRAPKSERRIMVGTPGIGDIMGVYRGRAIAIETKVRDKQLKTQSDFQTAFELAGGLYAICRSVKDAVDALDKLDVDGCNSLP